MINFIDENASNTHEDVLIQKVNEFSSKLEGIMDEWKLEDLMKAEYTTYDFRCLIADHISTYHPTKSVEHALMK